MPVTDDGMFALCCPTVFDHRFAVPADRDDQDTPLYCPHCGHTGDIWAFMPPEAVTRVRAAGYAAAEQYVHDAIKDAFRGFSGRSHSPIRLTESTASTPPPRRTLPSYTPDPTRRLKTCSRCQRSYAVFGIAVFCALCGRLTPADELAEAVEVQRKVLDHFAALPADQAAQLTADGAADRVREGTVKDAATALEVFLRSVFSARVPNATTVAGTGNPFQNLDRAQRLFAEHLNISLNSLTTQWNTIVEGTAVRHILTHTGGIVDDRFLATVPTSTFRPGQRIHVSETGARNLLDAVQRLCLALDTALNP
jgi:hypothetical protein